MRTVFLNDEPRAIADDTALHRVAAGMRQAGIAALPVYEHATADGFALVRVPLWLFAGEGSQRPQLRTEQKAAPTVWPQPIASAECTCFLTAPCSYCTRDVDEPN